MGVPANLTDVAALNASFDKEFVKNFQGESDRLAEILGIFSPEIKPVGTVLKMLKVTGNLVNTKTDPTKAEATGAITLGHSSGSAYVEGDEVSLSKFNASLEAVGEIKLKPYRKMTSIKAVDKAGVVNSVMATDRKMLSLVRADIVKDFFALLETGTGEATAKGLQLAAATVDAKLGDTLEKNGDASNRIIHFISREDAAAYLGAAPITTQNVFGMTYLGAAPITTQNVFGMTYLQNFLGMTDVFLTSQVQKGKMYATPVENIHIFGADFGAYADAGLPYETSSNGLIGVSHTPAYDHVSVETNVLTGMLLFPEVKDYIIKGTIS